MLQIIGEDFELTPAIKEGVSERVEQVIDHLREKDKEVHPVAVYLTKNKGAGALFTVRMNVRNGKKNFTSSATDKDFYTALNRAKEHLIRQIDDRRKKRISLRHRQNFKKQAVG